VVDNGQNVYLGDGAGGFSKSISWSNSLREAAIAFVNGDGLDQGVRLLDVNSDSLPDIFIAAPGRTQIYLNSGKGWIFDAAWSASLASITEQATALMDPHFSPQTNGCSAPHCDGPFGSFPGCSPPHCKAANDPPGCIAPHCQPGETQNCTPAHCQISPDIRNWLGASEPFSLVTSKGDSKGVQLVDVNADGRLDILWSMSRSDTLFWLSDQMPVYVRGVFLNTGTGWVKNDVLTDALIAFDGEFVTDSEIQGYDVLDVNGDGFADIIRTRADKNREAFLGTGWDWIKNTSYTNSLLTTEIYSLDKDRRAQGLMPTDFNDDGLVDYIRATPSTHRTYEN